MTALKPFMDFDRFFVGFDDIVRQFDALSAQNGKSTFPPYDIVQTPNGYTITLAVAGFTQDDIAVELDKQNVLTVKGSVEQNLPEGHQHVVKLIAGRKFTRSWRLEQGLEVHEVNLQHGLLTIVLTKVEPDESASSIKRLKINTRK